MKKQLLKCIISIFLMLFSVSSWAQNPTYKCRIENTAQVSCNVYEFDLVLQRTGFIPLYLAIIQAGININPAIIPSGAIVNVAMVPGSSALSTAMQPRPDRFAFDASANCIILMPMSPSYANRTTITNNSAGTRVCRFRVACSQPFIPGTTNHSWSFSGSTGYPTKVFAYVGTTDTDITLQASHTVNVTTGNASLTNSGFPDPLPQAITADTTEVCLNSGVYPIISMANTQAGYTYYLYKNDTLVAGANGVCFGTGAAASFGYQATAGVYTAKSISCNGMIGMSGSVTITNATPQMPSATFYPLSGQYYQYSQYSYCILMGDPITFKAHCINTGIAPIINWYVSGVLAGNDSTFTFIPNIPSGFIPIYCEVYPSTESCLTYFSVITSPVFYINVNPPPPQIFNVSEGGIICHGDTTQIILSGSEPGVFYYLSKYPPLNNEYPCVTCQMQEGTGFPLTWKVVEAGRYWILIDGYIFCEGVPHYDQMNGSALVVSTAYALTEERTICTGETYHWQGNEYSVTGTYHANYQSAIGCDSNFTLHLNVVNPADKKLNVLLFLQSLNLDNGLMRQAKGVSGNQFAAGIADKVRVELHNASAPFEMAYTFDNIDLKTNGTLKIDSFPCDIFGKYYLVIKHRNSIETWSSEPLAFGEQVVVSYDFSLWAATAYGGNLNINGIPITFWGGDVSQDGLVDASDMALIDNASKPPTLMGYYPEDVNGDGIVDASDMAMIDNNSMLPVHVIRP